MKPTLSLVLVGYRVSSLLEALRSYAVSATPRKIETEARSYHLTPVSESDPRGMLVHGAILVMPAFGVLAAGWREQLSPLTETITPEGEKASPPLVVFFEEPPQPDPELNELAEQELRSHLAMLGINADEIPVVHGEIPRVLEALDQHIPIREGALLYKSMADVGHLLLNNLESDQAQIKALMEEGGFTLPRATLLQKLLALASRNRFVVSYELRKVDPSLDHAKLHRKFGWDRKSAEAPIRLTVEEFLYGSEERHLFDTYGGYSKAFLSPPYGPSLPEREATILFRALNAILFDNFSEEIEIYQWRSSGPGDEWWGSYCYTVLSPKRNCMVVLLASETD